MEDREDCQSWLQSNCPTFWSLLNESARRSLPLGIIEYIEEGGEAKVKISKTHLKNGEKSLLLLIKCCGLKDVQHAYRRDLSGIATAKRLSEFLCEVFLCSSLSKLSPKINLCPSSGKGTFCDVFFRLGDFNVYGEAKRYEDNWPMEETKPSKRSIVKAKPGENIKEGVRPRYMDLFSKLQGVPNQFPEGTLNILFLFHPSMTGEAGRYIRQALFGEHEFFTKSGEPELHEDGLFALQDWSDISACCFSRIEPVEGNLQCIAVWRNPRAAEPIPTQVRAALDSLKPKSDKSYERKLVALMN